MILGDCFPLSSNEKERGIKYPFSKIVVYWCALITVLSAVLVLIVLPDPLLLVYYFVFTFVLTVVIFNLKLHFLFRMEKSESSGNPPELASQKESILSILVSILFMSLPLILLAFLPPVSWFICLNVFVSSISLSEVVLFYYTR